MSGLQRVIISPRGLLGKICRTNAFFDQAPWRQLNCGDHCRQGCKAQQRHAMKVNFIFHAIRFC
jgi:hypothetical protein